VGRQFGARHPLITQQFKTDGVGLFIERLGRLIEVSAGGQTAIKDVMLMHLGRLEFERNLAARLYPFTHSVDDADSPKSVMIDLRYSFGRPVLASNCVPTETIAVATRQEIL